MSKSRKFEFKSSSDLSRSSISFRTTDVTSDLSKFRLNRSIRTSASSSHLCFSSLLIWSLIVAVGIESKLRCSLMTLCQSLRNRSIRLTPAYGTPICSVVSMKLLILLELSSASCSRSSSLELDVRSQEKARRAMNVKMKCSGFMCIICIRSGKMLCGTSLVNGTKVAYLPCLAKGCIQSIRKHCAMQIQNSHEQTKVEST